MDIWNLTVNPCSRDWWVSCAHASSFFLSSHPSLFTKDKSEPRILRWEAQMVFGGLITCSVGDRSILITWINKNWTNLHKVFWKSKCHKHTLFLLSFIYWTVPCAKLKMCISVWHKQAELLLWAPSTAAVTVSHHQRETQAKDYWRTLWRFEHHLLGPCSTSLPLPTMSVTGLIMMKSIKSSCYCIFLVHIYCACSVCLPILPITPAHNAKYVHIYDVSLESKTNSSEWGHTCCSAVFCRSYFLL